MKITFKNFTIHCDKNTDMYCMTDAWKAVNGTVLNSPNEWLKLVSTHKLLSSLQEYRGTLKKGNVTPFTEYSRVNDLEEGLIKAMNGGTFCVWQVILAYMTYLDEKFFAEMIKVFDAAFHSETNFILARCKDATQEEKKRIRVSVQGKESRIHLIDVLAEHGVEHGVVGMGYSICTETTYLGLYNKSESELKKEMGLGTGEDLRDHLSSSEISTIVFTEDLMVRKIKQDNARGVDGCWKVCNETAYYVKNMITAYLKPKLKQE